MSPVAIQRGTSVQTIAQLQRSRRQLDRRRHAAKCIVTAMKGGAALHLNYENGRALWRRPRRAR